MDVTYLADFILNMAFVSDTQVPHLEQNIHQLQLSISSNMLLCLL